ncbi:NACHT domain-containing protein [Actinoplanes sp. NPDC051851]|uniref:NACHT domain-containing protein n=1 Tax=Actinoplanes sp. NPDC051851 TaxID=3154753 RepID=UPI00342625E8
MGADAELAREVSQQWEHEALIRGAAPVAPRWASTARPVAAPAAEVLGPDWTAGRALRLRLRGAAADLAGALLALPSRRLVVLGAPGSGKSALATRLVRDLLDLPGAPVPVLLSLATWQPETQPLGVWLATRIARSYPSCRDAAGLLAAARILPILDGLDRIGPAAMPRLGEYLTGPRPIVITCRTGAYASLIAHPLSRTAVVELEPST